MAVKVTNKIRTTADSLRVQGNFVPDTLNLVARTVDVVFATDAPVLMGWYDQYYEILSFDDGHVRMGRLNAGAPLLDSHNRYAGTANQPGVVEKAWVKDGKGYCTLRFSNDAGKNGQPDGQGEKIMQRVAEGITRCVSIGYNVFTYEEAPSTQKTSVGVATENSIPTYRAIDWEPYEVSFVLIPADTGAGVRSANGEKPSAIEINLLTNQNTEDPMKFRNFKEAGTPAEGPQGGGGNPAPAAAPVEQQRSAPTPPAQAPAPAAAPVEQQRSAEENERTQHRSIEIMDICDIAGLPLKFARSLTNDENSKKPMSEIRAMIKAELETNSNATAQRGGNRSITTGQDEADKRRSAMEDALLHRAMPSVHKLTDAGREFRSLDLMGMARECIESVDPGATRGMSRKDIAERSLNLVRAGGLMSTSDFPLILGNTINRTLRAQYETRLSEWRKIARQNNSKDFRDKFSTQLSEGGDFDAIAEGGEYTSDYLTEGQEKYRVAKYGKKIGVTWETIINDDLGFISRIPSIIVDMSTRKQDDLVWNGQLINNPVMGDGNALFSVAHKNLVTAGAINVNNLGLARMAMRQQLGMRGKQVLNLFPSFLIVGPENEQLALQFMHNQSVYPVTGDQVNVWAGSMQVIVEPRITDTRWYLAAAPTSIDTIEYAFLEGEQELFTSTREGWDVDGIETKARMVFGAKAIDWRGLVLNPGV